MIKLTQVQRSTGDVYLTFQYDLSGQVQTVVIDAKELVDRLKLLRELVGRPLTTTDMKNVVVAVINEIRTGKLPLVETFPYENYIGVNLET